MTILMTGDLRKYSNQILEPLLEENHVVLLGDTPYIIKRKNLDRISRSDERKNRLSQVLLAYHPDMVVYSSYSLEGAEQSEDDLGMLTEVCDVVRRHHIPYFTVLYSNAAYNLPARPSGQQKIARIYEEAALKICRNLLSSGKTHLTYIRVPGLYATSPCGWDLPGIFFDAAEGKEVHVTYSAEKKNDFLAEKDLGELLARMADSPSEDHFLEYNLSGHNRLSSGQIIASLKEMFPAARITIEESQEAMPGLLENALAREEYHWYARQSLTNDFEVLKQMAVQAAENLGQKKEKAGGRGIRKILAAIRILAEVLFAVGIAEYLDRLIRGNAILQFLDFRLLAVSVMGTMNGLAAGIGSGILCSLLYLQQAQEVLPWQLILLNVQNWLPFATYMFLGAATAYLHDQHEDRIKEDKQQYGLLKERYDFLLGLYKKVQDDNEIFNDQIVGYQNSYGKIYQMVKALDVTEPDDVVNAAVRQLEEMLDSRSVAIFFRQKDSHFLRLAASSREVFSLVPKSLNMDDYQPVVDELAHGRAYINRKNQENMPSYAAPISDGEKVTGTVAILNASSRQMSTEFANKLFIITDLVASSLTRANSAYEAPENFVGGTRLRTKESMRRIFTARQKLAENSYISDVILRVEEDGRDLMELDQAIGKLVRSSDEYGYGSDGKIYVILHQAGDAQDIVKRRFTNAGLVTEERSEVP